jgi:hypothetical protein
MKPSQLTDLLLRLERCHVQLRRWWYRRRESDRARWQARGWREDVIVLVYDWRDQVAERRAFELHREAGGVTMGEVFEALRPLKAADLRQPITEEQLDRCFAAAGLVRRDRSPADNRQKI